MCVCVCVCAIHEASQILPVLPDREGPCLLCVFPVSGGCGCVPVCMVCVCACACAVHVQEAKLVDVRQDH